MFIKNRRRITLLAAWLCCTVFLVAGAGAALASDGTYQVLRSPVVKDNAVYELGTIMARFTAGQLQTNDVLTFRLPQDFIWTTAPLKAGQTAAGSSRQGTADWNTMTAASDYVRYGTANYIEVPKRISGDENGLFQGETPVLSFSLLSDNEVRMEITGNITPGQECVFYLYARRVYVPGGFTGQIQVTFDAPSSSGFAAGNVSSGRTSGTTSQPSATTVPEVTPEPAVEVTPTPVVNEPPVENEVQAVFTVGKPAFTLKGVETSMDVAPYLKGGRTYLPIRYAAQALGIEESGIEWDEADQSVAITSEGRRVKMTVGIGTMTVDDRTVTMDAPPELLAPGRVMVPLSWVTGAFEAEAQWDPASNTITVEKIANTK